MTIGIIGEMEEEVSQLKQAVKFEELVLKLANEQCGYVTRDNVSELLNISNSQAYRVLKKLADKGKLMLVGKGRTAKYDVIK